MRKRRGLRLSSIDIDGFDNFRKQCSTESLKVQNGCPRMSHTDDPARALPQLRLRDNLALKLVVLSAAVALVIIGHWAYLYLFGTPGRCLSCGVFLAELFILFFAVMTVVFGGGAMVVDHVLARRGIGGERRGYIYGAAGGVYLLLRSLQHVAYPSPSSSGVFFTLGSTPVTLREMDFFTLGMVVFLATFNCLAAFGVIKIQGRWKRPG